MNTNKLKISDSKTEFIVFRSPQLRCDLSCLSVNVCDSQTTQSLKVKYFLNFDDHPTAIFSYSKHWELFYYYSWTY